MAQTTDRLDGSVEEPSLHRLLTREGPCTFGVEEELMIVDPQTLDLAPRAAEIKQRAGDLLDVKLELPASQLELATPPRTSVAEVVQDMMLARRRLAEATRGEVRAIACGAHPFAAAEGVLNSGGRYSEIQTEYASVARRQLVCGLHVHVGLGGAARVLGVYNALRSHLPELGALAANAPWHGGRDSGMASVRPLISGALPRQGVPPAYESWSELGADLRWGARSGRLSSPREWWWELRLHPQLGTLEVRVPDAQSRVVDAAAIVATVCALVLWLAEQHDAGQLPPPAPSWRIAENRWSAARHGVDGQLADLRTGVPASTRDRLHHLLDAISAKSAAAGADAYLPHAHVLAERNGASRHREIAASDGPKALVEHLANLFAEPLPVAVDAPDAAPPASRDPSD
jgi:carboxylate-amine ligase